MLEKNVSIFRDGFKILNNNNKDVHEGAQRVKDEETGVWVRRKIDIGNKLRF